MEKTDYTSIVTEDDYGYIQFPLFTMRGCLASKDSLIRIRQAGLYNFASKITADIDNVIRQLIYDYHQTNLWIGLVVLLDDYELESLDFAFEFGVDGAYFDPDAIEEIKELFDLRNDILDKSIAFYRARTVEKMFGVSFTEEDFLTGRNIMKKIPPKEPMPMVNIRVLDDFLEGTRTQFEVEQFVGYLALRSILGKKPYCKTNYKHIRARMFGYSKDSDVPDEVKQTDNYQRYCKRYHMDKLMENLRDNWYVQTYSYHTRGLYISTGNVSIETLIRADETSKKSNKRKQRQKEISEARIKVLKEMGSNYNTLNKMFNKGD
jgi:hypothetical protein